MLAENDTNQEYNGMQLRVILLLYPFIRKIVFSFPWLSDYLGSCSGYQRSVGNEFCVTKYTFNPIR